MYFKLNFLGGALLSFLLIFLGGCRPYFYRSYPYSLGCTNLAENVQEAFVSNTVSQGEIFYEKWWSLFHDEQLSRFIEISLACHPDISIADARIRLACQNARVVRSALFPHLFGGVDVAKKKVSRLGEGFVPGQPIAFTETTLELMTAAYELDIWHKNRARYYAALDQMQAQIADYEAAKIILSTTIAAVYFDLQMKYARKEVTLERLKAREELLSLLKQQYNFGVISEYRLYEIDTAVQLLKDLNYQIEAEIAIDKHALSALVGNVASCCNESGELCALPAAEFKGSFPLPCTLPIDLLARRPDIIAQRWRVEATCFNIRVAKANFFPRIDLLGWIGFQSIEFAKLFRGETLIGGVEGIATLPLYLAGKLQGELGVARESLEIAIGEYNQTILNAVQEVSDALSDLRIAQERKITVEKSIKDATEIYNLNEQKFANGIANKLALLNSLENVLIQKDLEVRIHLSQFEAIVELIRAIGGGYYECASL